MMTIMRIRLRQFFCRHQDSELVDLVSHSSVTGVTRCYYICKSCGKGYVK